MNEVELYYTPPSDICFDEVKERAAEIWNEYEDPYRNEKLGRISNLENVGDNFMYIVAMFDRGNQNKLASRLSEETRTAIRDRMLDGGAPPMIIPF